MGGLGGIEPPSIRYEARTLSIKLVAQIKKPVLY